MNNSKQAVLSIVGIAILGIAVVGVSFAFFTYSRQGGTNNVITTGTIVFDSNVGGPGQNVATGISLSNQFPQAANYTGSSAQADNYSFNVHGTIPSTTKTVYYGVYVQEKDLQNSKVLFKPSEINIKMTKTETDTATDDSARAPGIDAFILGGYDGASGAALTGGVQDTTDGLLVAHGRVASGKSEQHDYTLTMWVNNTVTISDTDTTAKYRAKAYDAEDWPEGKPKDLTQTGALTGATYDNRTVYSDLYYSIKVNVRANDTEAFGAGTFTNTAG